MDPLRAAHLSAEAMHLRDGFDAALADELAALAQDVTSLGTGQLQDATVEGYVYRFSHGGSCHGGTDHTGTIQIDGATRQARVLRCDEHAVTLLLHVDIGSQVRTGATLALHPTFLHMRLRERLDVVFRDAADGGGAFNLPLALEAMGIGCIRVAPVGPPPAYTDDPPLSEEQTGAISLAFRSSVSVIAAPAGTGKTVTLGALIEAYYRAGKRVLIVAPSNTALDLTVLAAASRLGEGLVATFLRCGRSVGQPVRAFRNGALLVETAVRQARPELEEQRRSLLRRLRMHRDSSGRTANRTAAGSDETTIRQLNAVIAEQRALAQRLTRNARIVAMTLSQAYLSRDSGDFDVVVIDEASMALAPAVFMAAGLARSVVLAGDPFQLAAPVCSRAHTRRWLTTDVFQRLGVASAIAREESLPYVTQLTEQRRCAESITALHRELWYGPGLRTSAEVKRRDRQRPLTSFSGASLCYVDTSALRPSVQRPDGRTYVNPVHLRVVDRLIRLMAASDEVMADDSSSYDALLLSPFRGQARHLALVAKSSGLGALRARTVHKAQGAEAGIAILDLTVAPGAERTFLMREFGAMSDASRLLAVASSRGRSRLLVVGPLTWIAEASQPRTVIAKLCTYLLDHGQQVRAAELPP